MKFTEIKELLDKGFTPAQVMELNKEPQDLPKTEQKETAETPKNATVDNKPAEPDMMKELKAAITDLTHTIQANALLTDSQPKRETASVDSMLAAIIDPPRKEK